MPLPSNEETIELYKKKIRVLVEKIMDPTTLDEERYYYSKLYDDHLKALKYVGGSMNEVLTKDGWEVW
jgi:dynactin complex subunit